VELERPDDYADVAAEGHGLRHQGQAKRRANDASREAEAPDRKYFPQGFKLSRFLQYLAG